MQVKFGYVSVIQALIMAVITHRAELAGAVEAIVAAVSSIWAIGGAVLLHNAQPPRK